MRTSFLLSSAVTLLCLGAQIAQAAHATHMRNERYCEVIVAQSITNFAVFNTWGLNNCPNSRWEHLTEDQVKKVTGAAHVHLNGPRYWVIDGFEKTHLMDTTPVDFGGITMRQAGVLHLGLFDLLQAKQPYRIHQVERQSTWVYQAGKPVYELVSPQGQVFVMQSYSTQKAPQTLNSLASLGSRLHLPMGWTFKEGILRHTMLLPTVNNSARVLQDDYANTYQLASHDFLAE